MRRAYSAMANPLQTKDDQWRHRRENGSVPVFDPGLSPLGTDDEAGGARAPTDAAPVSSDRSPMPSSPEGSGGVRATPKFWYAAAAVIVLLLLAAAWMSFA